MYKWLSAAIPIGIMRELIGDYIIESIISLIGAKMPSIL